MDVLAHALWTSFAAKAANARAQKQLIAVGWAAFWGVFPDIFAFGATFAAAALSGDFGRPSLSGLPYELYNYSHSLVIWAVVFLAVWAIRRRVPLVMLGWALHILIDVPSHANDFYLTPVFFPLSDWKFTHGVSWSHPIYMVINYSALIMVSAYFVMAGVRRRRAQKYLSSEE